jgi:hypothetical protein
MQLIGHSDQGGRPDGVQVMVNKGYAFVGHMFSKGFSVIDVRDPRSPKLTKYVPAPVNTWTIHLQTYGDLLLVINAKDMFAEFQDERQYYRGSLGKTVGTAVNRRRCVTPPNQMTATACDADRRSDPTPIHTTNLLPFAARQVQGRFRACCKARARHRQHANRHSVSVYP